MLDLVGCSHEPRWAGSRLQMGELRARDAHRLCVFLRHWQVSGALRHRTKSPPVPTIYAATEGHLLLRWLWKEVFLKCTNTLPCLLEQGTLGWGPCGVVQCGDFSMNKGASVNPYLPVLPSHAHACFTPFFTLLVAVAGPGCCSPCLLFVLRSFQSEVKIVTSWFRSISGAISHYNHSEGQGV